MCVGVDIRKHPINVRMKCRIYRNVSKYQLLYSCYFKFQLFIVISNYKQC